jgi:predicted enzyme related to lactoylglutathione lyase
MKALQQAPHKEPHMTSQTTQAASPCHPAISHAIHWFEIPVTDMARSIAFYEQLLGISLRRELFSGTDLAVFPADEGQGVKGALMGVEKVSTSADGPLLYLNAGKSIDATLGRLAAAGGKLLLGPVDLPEGMGRFAHITDPDGQRIGLHALD